MAKTFSFSLMVLAVGVALTVGAAEVAFTGADASAPTDLSRVSGEIAVDVSAWEGVSSIPSRVTLAEFDPAAVEPGTVFTRKGLNNGTTIVYDPVTGALQMNTLTGLRIIFR